MAEHARSDEKTALLDRLIAGVREMPPEQLREVSEFANSLRAKPSVGLPERGSAEAILDALAQTNTLQFDPGELETLLAKIAQMRDLDFEEHG